MSMVEFSAVAKHFGTTQVLHDINLKIDAGEVVVIIGPSGSGKSTLLRCINKLEAISSGTLLVAGMHLIRVRKMSQAAAREQALALLERVGLRERAEHYPSELSGGQQQRVAIARALAVKPKMMLFDEPTSALDPELRHEVLKVMRSLADEGMTMIIVTHEIGFARDVASRLIFIDGGTIAEDGPPDILLNASSNPRLKEFLQHVS